MAKLLRIVSGLLPVLLLVSLPMFAYEVALKDGRVIHFQKYRATETAFLYVDDQDKEVSIPLSSVDFDRTRELNTKENQPLKLPGLITASASGDADSQPSLGEIAKNVRPKSAKVTSQRVFTNEDVAPHVPQSPSGPTDASGPQTADQYRASMLQLDRWLEDKAAKTPRELSNSVVGAIQFPGRDKWEQRIFEQKEKLVSSARSGFYVIQKMTAGQRPEERIAYQIALDKIVGDVRVQRSLYEQLITEGVKKASEWDSRPR